MKIISSNFCLTNTSSAQLFPWFYFEKKIYFYKIAEDGGREGDGEGSESKDDQEGSDADDNSKSSDACSKDFEFVSKEWESELST